MDFAPTRTIIALEGGYNLDSISVSSEACLRVLLGEEIPLKCSENELSVKSMKGNCSPGKIAFDACKVAINVFQGHWPILTKDKEILEFENSCIKRSGEKKIEIAAGHADAIIIKQDKFLKRLKESEIQFYKDLSDLQDQDYNLIDYLEETKLISKFSSKCFDITQIEGKNYAILENLCFMHPKASVIDLKLGKVTYMPNHSDDVKNYHINKSEKTISSKLGFRLSGMLLKDKKGNMAHKAVKEEIYYEITTETISDCLRKFLASNESENINIEATKYFTGFLREITEFFENKNSRSWIGTSLLFVLDNTTNYYRASWIDIGKYIPLGEGERDLNVLQGLQSVLKIFTKIIEEKS